MKFLVIIFIFIYYQGTLLYSQAVTRLTLPEVIDMAKKQSIAARQASTTRETKFWEWKTFLSNYKPQLILEGNLPAYTRSFTEVVQPDGSIQFQPIRYNNSSLNLSLLQSVQQTGGQIYATTQLQRFDDFAHKNTLYKSSPFAIGYQQPILKFNPLKWDKKIEPLKYHESQQVYIESLEKVALTSTSYYFRVLLAQVNLQIAQTNLQNTNTIVTITNEKFNLGKTTRNEILQLRLESLKAQKAIANAKRDLEISTLTLRAYLGLPNENKLELVIPSQILNVSISEEKALAEALENRSDAIRNHRQLLEAESKVAKAIGDNGLNATLTATLGFSNRGATIPDLYVKPQSQESVELELSIPILDWGRSKSRIKTAEAEKQLTQYIIEQDQQSFKQEIFTQVTLFEMLKNELTITAQTDTIASEKYQIAQERYILGLLSTTDLSIAFQEKDQAKRDHINALQDYWETHYGLRALTLYDFEKQEKIKP
ncbi:MAG: TolC family protein [Saprospiraceae bacterium]